MKYLGVDIGGTKCAIVLGDENGQIVEKVKFETKGREESIQNIITYTKQLFESENIAAIGVSCGGPLNSKTGLILSPPNLPGWDEVHIVEILKNQFRVPVFLQNDADACALAEWKFGAGKGCRNMVFLTFGTGLGAGLILEGKLYTGGCDMAGEIGHVRLYAKGKDKLHIGYGKEGSAEGYCSGGGIAQYGYGSAKEIAIKARQGDDRAIEIYNEVGFNLGRTLAILIDILNPDRIVIGSIFARCRDLIEPSMNEELKKEALGTSYAHCEIVPAMLGESIGDVAAICIGMEGLKDAK